MVDTYRKVQFWFYGLIAALFVSSLVLTGCSQKEAAKAAYLQGCSEGIATFVMSLGAYPDGEAILRYCEKESKTAEDRRN